MERVDQQLGEYRLLARLAEGGQSKVFLAARGGPHGFFRPVVIKALPEDFKGDRRLEALFYQEATISSRFAHPNVVTIHDAKRANGEHFMVMDYVAGQTVADLAQRAFSQGPGLALEETLAIGIGACRGLDYVHDFQDVDCRDYSIVHCDISPQNLMVTYNGVTRVFDFGISQVVGESGVDKTDLVGGKFTYMSPEQCLEEPLDIRSDIFSLGIILYELAAGTRLFRRGDHNAVVEAITSEPIAPPSTHNSELDEQFDRVVLKALERQPEDRYATAGQFQRQLSALLEGLGADIDEVREGLGRKVADLFEQERQTVASTLHNARQRMSEQAFTPVNPDNDDDDPSERELELEEQLEEAEQRIDELRTSAERATEVASALTEEVTELRERQNWFVAGMCVLSLVALAVAALAHLAQ